MMIIVGQHGDICFLFNVYLSSDVKLMFKFSIQPHPDVALTFFQSILSNVQCT